jgi:MFS family permease
MNRTFSFWRIVFLPSLGYFVDSYDLILFNAVRIQSLTDLGYPIDQVFHLGVSIGNAQRVGLILGGFFWGSLADKLGRQRMLYSSLFLFSFTTLLNAFVQNSEQYFWLRFFCGFGLSAELGLCVASITETIQKNRTLALATIASIGLLGGAFASFIQVISSWRSAYLIGGLMGFLLMITRHPFFYRWIYNTESVLYIKARSQSEVRFGSIKMLFFHKKRFLCLLSCIGLSTPCALISSVLMAFGPEIAQSLFIRGITNADCLISSFLGCTIGDFISGLLSQKFCSRKKVIALYLLLFSLAAGSLPFLKESSVFAFQTWCFVLGLASGYWIILVAGSAEQFGINLRATATNIITNTARSMGIPLTLAFQFCLTWSSFVSSCFYVFSACLCLVFLSWHFFKETFHENVNQLDF